MNPKSSTERESVDFGFILNDDILFEDNWYISYYEASMQNKIEHLCWLKNTDSTILDKERALKNNGCVLKANGVLLTFTKNVVKNAGLFNENDFNFTILNAVFFSFYRERRDSQM